MALHAERNLYPGINIHLNSLLQNELGGWHSFHSDHTVHLCVLLDKILPPGYFARAEESIQPSQTDEVMLTGLVIYRVGKSSLLSNPVVRVEMLLPSSKPRGTHHGQYIVKREGTLRSGLRLVEIDYLHETPPVIQKIASYADRHENAVPYMILVSDPRPILEQGKLDFYGWGVDDEMPTISIPLAGADTVALDFMAAYNHTYTTTRFYRMVVDYAQDPVAFERYHQADQAKIRARLEHIRANPDDPTTD